MSNDPSHLDDQDYAALADFRAALRTFLAFSEAEANAAGLAPQQHQALLAIRGAAESDATVGYLARRLVLKPHSASELVKRLLALDLIAGTAAPDDRRKLLLRLTPKAARLLQDLSAAHRQEIRRVRPLLLDLLEKFS